MKFNLTFVATCILTLIIGCSDNDSYNNEIGVFISPEAIPFTDTSVNSLNHLEIHDKNRIQLIKSEVATFYRRNDFKSRWLYKKKPNQLANNFLNELSRAKDYGLDPNNYNYAELKARIQQHYDKNRKDLNELEQLDKEITASFLLFMNHLSYGRIRPENNGDKIWQIENDSIIRDEIKLLLEIDDQRDLEEILDTIHPIHPFYNKLRDQLRKINAENERNIKEFTVENAKAFKIGYQDSVVAKIRHNLNEWKIPVNLDGNLTLVDSNLINSIKLFQRKRNIAEDGLPGENTLLYLNMTKDKLIELISLNMERIRWLKQDFGDHYILVNVPEFMLRVYDEDDVKVKMKVIVGEEYNPTPIFSDTLKYIVFRPTWTVPQSIIKDEMVANLIKDPEYYTKRDFKIYEGEVEINPRSVNWKDSGSRYFTFVQQPSTSNALGLVKFIMPNNMSIYLHDTPTDHLFEREERALSHGCIRLERPSDLATYLLRDVKGWNREKVEQSLVEGDTKRVDLKTLYHVQIAYLTTWVEDDGSLKIVEDIYGHDAAQLNRLREL